MMLRLRKKSEGLDQGLDLLKGLDWRIDNVFSG